MTNAVRSTLLPLALLAGTFLLASCGGGDKSTAPGRTAPASLDIVSGDGQTGTVGAELPSPLVVRVTDANGAAVAGQIVNFRVVKGGGSVFAGTAITNKDGLARERWTLGTVARDTQQVEARAVDPETGDPLVFATFKAVGQAAAGTELRKIAGDGQTGTGGLPLRDSLVVRLFDQYGNAVAGAPITWTAASGSIAGAATTDAVGRAAARWTLGTSTGPQQATAQSGSLTALFTATATASSAPTASIDIAPHPDTIYVGRTLQLSATPRDAYGNPTTDVVTWSLTSDSPGAVTLTSYGAATAKAEGTPKIVVAAGSVSDTVPLTVLEPVTQVTVTLARPSIHVGDTTRATVVLQTRLGTVSRPYTLSSTAPQNATVDGLGLVKGVALGKSNIVARTDDGATGQATVNVVSTGPARVVISPDSLVMNKGDTITVHATVYDSTGEATTTIAKWYPFNWQSVDVIQSGLVYAKAVGRYGIMAYLDSGPRDTAWVTVKQGPTPVTRIDVSFTRPGPFYPGDTVTASAQPRDATGGVITGRTVTWSSGDARVLGVQPKADGTALVSVLASGNANVVATLDGVTGNGPVEVRPVMSWSSMSSPTTDELLSVWGTSPTNVYAVASKRVLHYDGSSWTTTTFSDTGFYAERIWGFGPSNIFVRGFTMAGDHLLQHFDGTQWSSVSLPALPAGGSGTHAKQLWASSLTDVWAIFNDPAQNYIPKVAHYTGGSGWTVSPYFLYSVDIWGTSATNLWVLGSAGDVYWYDGGTNRSATSSGAQRLLPGPGDSVYVSGSQLSVAYRTSSAVIANRGASGAAGPNSHDVFVASGSLYRYIGSTSPRPERVELTGSWRDVWSYGTTVFAVGDGGAIVKGTAIP